MSADEVNGDWAVALFEGVRCDEHLGPIPAGTPYKLDRRQPGRMRRVCRNCIEGPVPDKLPSPFPVSRGESACGWCGETPPAGEPWTTIHVATADSRACVDCWTRWDQGLPLREGP